MPQINTTTVCPSAAVLGAARAPFNGPCVAIERELVGAARRLTPVRADTASVARGWHPLRIAETQKRVSAILPGAAQLAAR